MAAHLLEMLSAPDASPLRIRSGFLGVCAFVRARQATKITSLQSGQG